jgi:hypothetical protein
MDSLASNPYGYGAVILALIGAIVSLIKINDNRIAKIISDHQTENKEVRQQSAAQTMVVIEAVKSDAAAKQQLAQSIDELKAQQKENTEMFYEILRQKNPS